MGWVCRLDTIEGQSGCDPVCWPGPAHLHLVGLTFHASPVYAQGHAIWLTDLSTACKLGSKRAAITGAPYLVSGSPKGLEVEHCWDEQ